jgi:hypothetical protein
MPRKIGFYTGDIVVANKWSYFSIGVIAKIDKNSLDSIARAKIKSPGNCHAYVILVKVFQRWILDSASFEIVTYFAEFYPYELRLVNPLETTREDWTLGNRVI